MHFPPSPHSSEASLPHMSPYHATVGAFPPGPGSCSRTMEFSSPCPTSPPSLTYPLTELATSGVHGTKLSLGLLSGPCGPQMDQPLRGSDHCTKSPAEAQEHRLQPSPWGYAVCLLNSWLSTQWGKPFVWAMKGYHGNYPKHPGECRLRLTVWPVDQG